jgi:hypothetical protein
MDCHEARNRLTGSTRDKAEPAADRELREHLAACPRCAEYARGAGTLVRLMAAASENDDLAIPSLDSQRVLVEAHLAKGSRRRPGFVGAVTAHPGLGFGLGFTAVALVVLAAVPFTFYQTVGYEVAVDGVEQELVQTDEHFCDMLFRLGLHEADVELLGCDSTCALNVYHLKSVQEAQLVAAVFSRIDPVGITADVKEVRAKTSSTLLERANEKILEGLI